jgi:hypothetical protein
VVGWLNCFGRTKLDFFFFFFFFFLSRQEFNGRGWTWTRETEARQSLCISKNSAGVEAVKDERK